jgi:iron(III) transport system ATP-binding protein
LLGDAVILPAEMTGGQGVCALGPVSLDDKSAQGPGRILFRPEHLLLIAADASQGIPAMVTSIEYTGHECTAALRIDRHADPILVRCSPTHLPVIGDHVRVAAPAVAHVLSR